MNNITFEKYFDAIEPFVPGELISKSSFDEMRKSASILPSELVTYTFGFECELGDEAPEADFLLSFNTELKSRKALENPPLPEDLRKNKVWKSIMELNRKWNDEKDFIHHRLDYLWLEFDVRRKNYYVPGLFFAPLIFTNSKLSRDEQYVEIFRRVFSLFGMPAPGKKEIELPSVLPESVSIFQVGILPAREVPFRRFCLTGMTEKNIEGFFSDMGYSGDIGELKNLFKMLSGYVDKIEVDIDAGDEMGSKVGFECYIHKPKKSEEKSKEEEKIGEGIYINKWTKFLDMLTEKEICLKEKAAALMEYPGVSDSEKNSDIWPLNLKDALAMMKVWKVSLFRRSLHHVKIVYEPGKELQAKAYLAVNHYWKR